MIMMMTMMTMMMIIMIIIMNRFLIERVFTIFAVTVEDRPSVGLMSQLAIV